VAAVLLLGVAPSQPVEGAVPEAAQFFEQGIKAFRGGDYPAALQSFLDASRAGLDTPGLHYDLGATYYRLQRYPDSEREFLGLAKNPEWAALAHYNLGLIAQRTGREQLAIQYFSQAQRAATDGNLRALAETALARLVSAPPLPRTNAVTSVAGGYDSNAALSPDAATAAISHQGDSFAEALTAASHRLTGEARGGSYAYGGLALRKYADLHQFDLLGLRAGLAYETDSSRLQTSAGGYFDAAYLGGSLFQQTAVVDLQARRRLDAGRDLRGRYQFGSIRGGAGFEYLDGWEQRFAADTGFALSPAFVRLGYELELNNRRDLQQGADFTSASPTRHSLFVTFARSGPGGWQVDARGEYRVSRYNDPDLVNGGALEVRHKDDRYGFAVRASRRLSAQWRAFVDTSYYRNNSSLDIYDYGRYQLMVGIEAAFVR